MIRMILLFLLPFCFIYGESVVEWNQKGISALLKKDFKKAEEYLKKSLSLAPENAKANYNLACTYALMKSQCEDLSVDIYDLLRKAVAGDANYKSKMLKDSDLEAVKNNIQFYKIAGLNNKQILTKIIWYGPKPGVANIDKLIFYEKGNFTYYLFNASGEMQAGYTEYNGNYVWKEDYILIQFPEKAPYNFGKKILKVFMKENTIKVEGLDHNLTDFEDRCSA